MTRVRAHTQQVTEPDEIIDRLRESGHSVGRTRRAVVDAVRTRDGAFTADELAAAVPDVHVATVYRTLALLEEIGALRHVHLSHGAAIYEPSLAEPVRHLVCEVCGRHVAVPNSLVAGVSTTLADEYDFVLEGTHFAIVGRCATCAST